MNQASSHLSALAQKKYDGVFSSNVVLVMQIWLDKETPAACFLACLVACSASSLLLRSRALVFWTLQLSRAAQ